MKKTAKASVRAGDFEVLAKELRAILDGVLAHARARDWSAASRTVLDLVHATRRIETVGDFMHMNEWRETTKDAGVPPPKLPGRRTRRATR
jgi:hypothetical protein